MLPERLRYLLAQYSNGNLQKEEHQELLEYFDSKEDGLLMQLLEEMAQEPLPAYHQPTERANAIADAILQTKQAEKAPVRKLNLRWLSAAAAIVIIFSGALYFLSGNKTTIQAKSVTVKPEHQGTRYLLLPDSSRVILNQGASLTYTSFAGNTREVKLVGEAFFDIRHDADKPFIVYTGRVKTIVLGTAFNIRAAGSSQVTVTVTRGKVRVEDGGHPVALLTPNQQVTVDTASGKTVNATVNAEEVTGWNHRELRFDDASLGEVALAIELKFNTKVRFAIPAMMDNHITASFIKNESLEDILKVITKINGMNYRISEEGVLIGSN